MKVVLVGDGGVGKTTFVKRLVSNTFERNYQATDKCDHVTYLYSGMKFDIYDKAGQEKFVEKKQDCYTNANAALIMYDCSSLVSANSVSYWYEEVRKNCGHEIPILVCGNKSDLTKKDFESLTTFCQEHNLEQFNISCKTGDHLFVPLEYIRQKVTGENNREALFANAQKAAIQQTIQQQLMPLLRSLHAQQQKLDPESQLFMEIMNRLK